MQPSLKKVSILGVGITPTSYEDVCRTVRTWVLDRKNGTEDAGRSIFACAVHAVMSGVFQKETKSLLNSSNISTPDGMAVAWAMRSFGVRGQTRVYGPTLMLHLCKQASELGHSVYLYGGRDVSVPATAYKLVGLFPRLQIVGIHPRQHPPQTADEDADDVRRIRASGADIMFVGFGAPRQEQRTGNGGRGRSV
jgi:N-acetylglucosaminyldiphosphoundecaprenol N-acetyl-beta-D-mannosaminyltransferase